jgi:hypothetical protein
VVSARVLLLGVALLWAGSCLAAQSAPVTRLRVMIEFSGPAGAAGQGYEASLESALIQSPSVLAVLRAPPGDEPLAKKAVREACPVALRVSLELGAESSRLGWETYLPPSEEPVDRGEGERGPPDARSLSTTFWHDPVSALEAAIAEAKTPSSFVRIVAAPGTKLHGIGAELVIPESGEADIPLVLPAYIVWSAEADGARPESGKLLVEESGTLIEIPHRPPKVSSPWSIEVSALGFSFPEISARRELGNRLFARATMSQYFFGLSLQDSSGDTGISPIVASYGLLQPGLGIGYRFSRVDAPFRLYSSLDFFLRLAFIEEEGVMIEPVAPWGCCLAVGSDWGRRPTLRLFLEMGLVLYPWADRVLMLASRSGKGMGRATMGGGGLFASQPGWFAEFPQPRIGLRMRL